MDSSKPGYIMQSHCLAVPWEWRCVSFGFAPARTVHAQGNYKLLLTYLEKIIISFKRGFICWMTFTADAGNQCHKQCAGVGVNVWTQLWCVVFNSILKGLHWPGRLGRMSVPLLYCGSLEINEFKCSTLSCFYLMMNEGNKRIFQLQNACCFFLMMREQRPFEADCFSIRVLSLSRFTSVPMGPRRDEAHRCV